MQQLDISNQLDKNIAGLVNLIFGIENATLITSVNLNTLLVPITFYIIPINTPCLLYLADIHKPGAFFNNVINEVIQL